MKTAKEMFESLGWRDNGNLVYKKGFQMIWFYRDESADIIFGSTCELNMELLKAVIKQCKELGWLEE